MNSRNLFIDKLETARQLVATYFESPGCTWDGRYHAEQHECRQCVDAAVCSWIFAQDPAPDLTTFSETQLIDALIFAGGFLEGQMFGEGHDSESCACQICLWVRDIHKFTSEL
jgi:hypothetical protein